jgi:hypothetical protein
MWLVALDSLTVYWVTLLSVMMTDMGMKKNAETVSKSIGDSDGVAHAPPNEATRYLQ